MFNKEKFNPRNWLIKGDSNIQSNGKYSNGTYSNALPDGLRNAIKAIYNATEGEKHYKLRNVSYLFGGYVAGGLVDENDACCHLKEAIGAKDGVKDLSAAYKTIERCLIAGKTKPIYEDLSQDKQTVYINEFSSNGSAEIWEDPISINQSLPPVQPMTPELIPEPLKDWVIDIAERMQCPLDYPVVSSIVLVGSLIGANCGIKPKQKDDWIEVPNLWGALIGSPSQLKSPSIKSVFAPLFLLEKKNRVDFENAKKEYNENERLQNIASEALNAELKKAYTKNNNDNLEDIKKKIKVLNEEKITEPKLKRYKSNDLTIEKLGELCSENPQGILVMRDELTGLLATWEKQGHESDRAFYLESWNGTNNYMFDRISRGSTYIENLCVSLFGSIQPDKLQSYLYKIRKGNNDGMMQRFQLAVYPDEPRWTYVDRYPNEEARNRAYAIIENIPNFDYYLAGAQKSTYDKIPSFRYDIEAQWLLEKWFHQLENEKLRNEDYHPLVREHFAKYRSLVPCLSLIFHIINLADQSDNSTAITATTIRMAIKWSEYLEAHAIRIYNGLGNPYQNASFELARKISKGYLKDNFAVRDIQQKDWHLLNSNELITDAINELVDLHWIKEAISPKNTSGRPPSPRYIINPKTRKFIK